MAATPTPPLLRMEAAGLLTHPAPRMAAPGEPAQMGRASRVVMAELVAMQLRLRRPAGASATPTHPAPRTAAPAEMATPAEIPPVMAVMAAMQQQQPLPRLQVTTLQLHQVTLVRAPVVPVPLTALPVRQTQLQAQRQLGAKPPHKPWLAAQAQDRPRQPRRPISEISTRFRLRPQAPLAGAIYRPLQSPKPVVSFLLPTRSLQGRASRSLVDQALL